MIIRRPVYVPHSRPLNEELWGGGTIHWNIVQVRLVPLHRDIGDPLAVARPAGLLLASSVCNGRRNVPLQVVNSENILAVSRVVGRNQQFPPIRRHSWKTETCSRELTQFLALTVEPDEPGTCVRFGLEYQQSVLRCRKSRMQESRIR